MCAVNGRDGRFVGTGSGNGGEYAADARGGVIDSLTEDGSEAALQEAPNEDGSGAALQEAPNEDGSGAALQEAPNEDGSGAALQEAPSEGGSGAALQEAPNEGGSEEASQEAPDGTAGDATLKEDGKEGTIEAPENTQEEDAGIESDGGIIGMQENTMLPMMNGAAMLAEGGTESDISEVAVMPSESWENMTLAQSPAHGAVNFGDAASGFSAKKLTVDGSIIKVPTGATGLKLYLVKNFTGFNKDKTYEGDTDGSKKKADQSGYYVALRLKAPIDIYEESDTTEVVWIDGDGKTASLTGSTPAGKAYAKKDFNVTNKDVRDIVLRVADSNGTWLKRQIIVDWDGTAGLDYTPHLYTLNLSGSVTLDSRKNSTIASAGPIPSTEWETIQESETWKNGAPAYSDVMPGAFTVDSKITDTGAVTGASGKIILKADPKTTLNKVEGWTSFGTGMESGYYAAIRLTVPDSVSLPDDGATEIAWVSNSTDGTQPTIILAGPAGNEKVIADTTIKKPITVGGLTDGKYIDLISRIASDTSTNRKKTIIVDWDGLKGVEYKPVAYTIDLTAAELATKKSEITGVNSYTNKAQYENAFDGWTKLPAYDDTCKVQFTPGSITGETDYQAKVAVTGELAYVNDFCGFVGATVTSDSLLAKGAYVAFRIPLTDEQYKAAENSTGNIFKTGDGTGGTGLGKQLPFSSALITEYEDSQAGETFYWIDCIINVNKGQEENKAKNFKVWLDFDGNGGMYDPVTYTFDMSKVTLKQKDSTVTAVAGVANASDYTTAMTQNSVGDTGAPAFADTQLKWTLDPTDATGTTYTASIVNNKKLVYKDGWTGNNSAKGYFTVLKFTVPETLKNNMATGNVVKIVDDSTGKIVEIDNSKFTGTGTSVMYLIKQLDPGQEKFTVTFDWDIAAKEYKPTVYTFNIPKTVYGGDLKDSKIEKVTVMTSEHWGRDTTLGGAFATENPPAYADVCLTPNGEFAPDAQKKVYLRGTLKYIKGFTGFSVTSSEQNGFYAALRIPVPDAAKTAIDTADGIILTVNKNYKLSKADAKGNSSSGYYINLIQKVDLGKNFTVMVDWDGSNGVEYTPTTYTFDVSGIEFQDPRKWGSVVTTALSEYKILNYPAAQSIDQNGDTKKTTLKYTSRIRTTTVPGGLGYGDDSEGYFVAIKITAPDDMDKDTVMVKTQWGEDEGSYSSWNNFSDTKEGESKEYFYHIQRIGDKTKQGKVTVLWDGDEDDGSRVEEYILDFTGAELYDPDKEIENAPVVAPKSMKLAAPQTTMYVGDTQTLSVNVVKNYPTDKVKIIFFKNSKEDHIALDSETGEVTALSPTKKGEPAIITVYAMVTTEEGTLGAVTTPKPIELKITVTDIAAPSGLKIGTVEDTRAELIWKPVREDWETQVWTAKVTARNSKWTVQDFEDKIEDLSELVATNEYTKADPSIGKTGNWLNALKPETAYAVYIRNYREGDSDVEESHNGVVTTITTTKQIPTVFNWEGDDKPMTLSRKSEKYYVTVTGYNSEEDKNDDKPNTDVKYNYYSTNPSVAQVNKTTGAVTLKKGGTFRVWAQVLINNKIVDTLSPREDKNRASSEITVNAKSSKISNLTTRLYVGQPYKVADLVKFEYSDPSNALEPDSVDAVFEAGGKRILSLGGGWFVATAPGKFAAYGLEAVGNDFDSVTANVEIKDLPAPGTPSLYKKTDGSGATNHETLDISFKRSNFATRYRVDLLSSKVPEKIVDSMTFEPTEFVGKNLDEVHCTFYDLSESTTYYVKVTARCEFTIDGEKKAAESKSVTSAALKTTKRTAVNEDKKNFDAEDFTARYVSTRNANTDKKAGDELTVDVVTGEGYTINLDDVVLISAKVDDLVRGLESDTLEWTVDNRSIVSIKGNKSSFDVAVTAVKVGETTVTVKSKTTKKVFGTFKISVGP